jgi:plastocyanin
MKIARSTPFAAEKLTMRAAILAVAATVMVCVIGLTAGERPKPKTHTVTIENMRFEPASLTVARGDTVVWLNKDLVPHSATSKAGGFDSQVIQPEKSWRFTVTKRGDFAYVCTFHPTMTAMLRVM